MVSNKNIEKFPRKQRKLLLPFLSVHFHFLKGLRNERERKEKVKLKSPCDAFKEGNNVSRHSDYPLVSHRRKFLLSIWLLLEGSL